MNYFCSKSFTYRQVDISHPNPRHHISCVIDVKTRLKPTTYANRSHTFSSSRIYSLPYSVIFWQQSITRININNAPFKYFFFVLLNYLYGANVLLEWNFTSWSITIIMMVHLSSSLVSFFFVKFTEYT